MQMSAMAKTVQCWCYEIDEVYVTATDQAPAYLWMTASGRPAAPPKVQKSFKLDQRNDDNEIF